MVLSCGARRQRGEGIIQVALHCNAAETHAGMGMAQGGGEGAPTSGSPPVIMKGSQVGEGTGGGGGGDTSAPTRRATHEGKGEGHGRAGTKWGRRAEGWVNAGQGLLRGDEKRRPPGVQAVRGG